jgi:putative ABC transport system permease protein
MKHLSTSISLAVAYLRDNRLATALNVLLLSLGVGTIIALVLLLAQAEERMERDSAGIDLVIGAKGSPMQLILSSVFHVDVPTGNVRLGDAQQIIAEPAVKRAIPLALGDSIRSFRIVGTNPELMELYGAKLTAGRIWDKPLEAVLGADAARLAGLRLGDSFAGTHGLSEAGGHAHEDHKYVVVGLLAPTGAVIDRLVLTSVASVWKVHDHEPAAAAPNASAKKGGAHHHDGHDSHSDHDHAGHDHAGAKEVTAYLIQYATPLAAVSFPRLVNSSSTMQAASPALEAARLFQLVGVGVDALKGFAIIMMLCAGLGIFIGLMSALDERRADLALLRVLGAPPGVVVLTTLLQGLMLGVLGVILGVALGHLGAEWVGQAYAASQRVAIGGRIWVQEEWLIIASALGLALLASLVPAWRAYREATPELLARR